MGVITNIANKLGFVPSEEVTELRKEITDLVKKSNDSWGKLFSMGQEWRLFGDKVTKPYEQIASVYKAVKAIADNVPQANLIFRDKKSKKPIQDDDIIELFENPNPLMTKTDFIQAWVGFFCLSGESMVIKEASVGQLAGTRKLPAELWVFNPSDFQEITDNGRYVLGWRYNKESRVFKPEETIYMRDFNPHSLFRGLSPTKPIEKIIDIDWQTLIFNKAFFDNGAKLGLTLGTDQRLNDETIKRLKSQIEERHKGADNAFKIAIFEAGLKILDDSVTHKDMDFMEQKRFSREEIYGIWKVPKAMFSITDDLNYATFIGQMKMFWNYTIMPALKKVESSINTHLVVGYNPKIEAAFDLSGVIAYQEDFKEKIDTATKLFAMGFTRNEINEKLELGFEDKPWGDTWWISFGQVPADAENDFRSEINNDPEKCHKSAEDVQREIAWKSFLVKQIPLEKTFSGVIKKYFFEQRKDALEALNSFGAEGFRLDWDYQNKTLKEKTKQHIYLGIKDGVDFAKTILGKKDAAFNEEEAKIQSYLTLRLDKITRINTTVREQLKTELSEGIAAGETVMDMADRIRSVYNMASSRSLMIARTESVGAVNGGSNIYYEQAGVKKKEWLTAHDEHVRESHKKIDGEIVLLNNDFSNGLAYPGDMKGEGEDIINCRCTILPKVE